MLTNKKKYRRSEQRNRILKLLQTRQDHPRADWIYQELKKEFPRLSMGNIYRNLNILLEQGLIRKIDFGSTFDRYDGIPASHYHFVCQKCQMISDLNIPPDHSFINKIGKKINLTVRDHHIQFFGICKTCEKEDSPI